MSRAPFNNYGSTVKTIAYQSLSPVVNYKQDYDCLSNASRHSTNLKIPQFMKPVANNDGAAFGVGVQPSEKMLWPELNLEIKTNNEVTQPQKPIVDKV